MNNAKEIKKFMKRVVRQFDNGSPFSAMRESEINEKIRQNRLFEIRSETQLIGVVNARELTRSLTMRDFAQRAFTFDVGTIFISDFVFHEKATEAEMDSLLSRVSDRLGNHWISVEFYAEDRRLKNFFQKKNFERVMTKVTAFAEVKVVYSNCFQPSLDLFNTVRANVEEDATLLTVHENFFSESNLTTSLAELDNALALEVVNFAPHYSIYNKDDAWSGISLRGYMPDDPSFIEKPTEMSRAWKKENPQLLDLECQETRIAHSFFYTLAKLKGFLSPKLERVRVLRLTEGNIYRHCDIQDKDAGLADGKIARFHVPLVTNDFVTFNSWSASGNLVKMKMKQGDLCYLDHRKPHAVQNTSKQARLHLVVDVYSDEKIREMIRSAMKRAGEIV